MGQKNQKKLRIMSKISKLTNSNQFHYQRIIKAGIVTSAVLYTLHGVVGMKHDTRDAKPSKELKKIVHGMNRYSDEFLCVFSYTSLLEARLINRFINFLTKKGKKATAESLFMKTLYLLSKKIPVVNTAQTILEPMINGKANVQLAISGDSSPVNPLIEKSSSLFFIIHQAIENVKPFFEVKKVRVAGTTYQVPSLVQSNRQENLAINWLIQSAHERKKKNPSQAFEICLAFEIYEAFQKQGQARNKRNELHKLAEVNRAFSHFRWW